MSQTKNELYKIKRKLQQEKDELEQELKEWRLDAETYFQKLWMWVKTRKVPVAVGFALGWNACYFLGSLFGIGQ